MKQEEYSYAVKALIRQNKVHCRAEWTSLHIRRHDIDGKNHCLAESGGQIDI